METRASHLLVGSFVLMFMAAMIGFAIWMAKVNPDAEYQNYDIYFEGTVSGLVNRGTVFYLGIAVGEVRSISLAPDPRMVKVTVRLQKEVPVNSKSRAKLEFQGLTGVAYIEIFGGAPDAAPLTVQDGQEYPVIASEVSNFQALFDKAPNLVDETIKAVGAIQLLLGEANRSQVAAILENSNRLSANLADGTENLDQLMAKANVMMDSVNTTLIKVSSLVDNGNDLLENEVKTLMADATQAVQSLNALAMRMDGLVQANEGAVTTFVSGTLPEISRMIMDLRSTARALSRLSAKIEANPARVLFPGTPAKFDPKTGKPKKEEK